MIVGLEAFLIFVGIPLLVAAGVIAVFVKIDNHRRGR